MNLQQFYTRKAIGFIIVLIVAGLIAGFFALNNYIYQEKQGTPTPSGTPIDNDHESYRGTLVGEYLCLPHVNTSGPQTLECALGLKTDSGEYYALDFYLMSQMGQNLATGDRISANGLITPIERLSTEIWRKYPIKGVFSVTDSLKVIK